MQAKREGFTHTQTQTTHIQLTHRTSHTHKMQKHKQDQNFTAGFHRSRGLRFVFCDASFAGATPKGFCLLLCSTKIVCCRLLAGFLVSSGTSRCWSCFPSSVLRPLNEAKSPHMQQRAKPLFLLYYRHASLLPAVLYIVSGERKGRGHFSLKVPTPPTHVDQ